MMLDFTNGARAIVAAYGYFGTDKLVEAIATFAKDSFDKGKSLRWKPPISFTDKRFFGIPIIQSYIEDGNLYYQDETGRIFHLWLEPDGPIIQLMSCDKLPYEDAP